MPRFVCPILSCKYHDGNDCEIGMVTMNIESGKEGYNFVCTQQDLYPDVCYFCGIKMNSTSNICKDCLKESEDIF